MLCSRALLLLVAMFGTSSAFAASLVCVSHKVSDPTFISTHAIDIFVKNVERNTNVRGSDIRSAAFAEPYPKLVEPSMSQKPAGPECRGDWCERTGADEILVRSPQFSPDNPLGRHCFTVEVPRRGMIEIDFSARKRVGLTWLTACRATAWIKDDPTQGDRIVHFIWWTTFQCVANYPNDLKF